VLASSRSTSPRRLGPRLLLVTRARSGVQGQLWALVVHLARRRLESEHRFTTLGWLWPLIRQLAQLLVLVVIFGSVLELGIPDYPLFVFAGLIVWTWFANGLSGATTSLVAQRHLVYSPRLPDAVIPLVAVAVPLVDLLIVLPVLFMVLAIDGRLTWAALLLPVLLLLQFALTAGLSLVASAWNVFFRDTQNIVTVGLTLLFYLTPIFYGTRNVPERYRGLLDLNPMTAMVNAVRSVLLDGTLPRWQNLATLGAAAGVALAVGVVVFHRLQPRFVDEL
jgi:lipopolysaccharide transport system permease protein